MSLEALKAGRFALPSINIRVTGWSRLLRSTLVFLLIIFSLVIMNAWIDLLQSARLQQLEVETQELYKDIWNSKVDSNFSVRKLSELQSLRRIVAEATQRGFVSVGLEGVEFVPREAESR